MHLVWFPSDLSTCFHRSSSAGRACCPPASPRGRVLLQLSARAALLPSLWPAPQGRQPPPPGALPSVLRAVLISSN